MDDRLSGILDGSRGDVDGPIRSASRTAPADDDALAAAAERITFEVLPLLRTRYANRSFEPGDFRRLVRDGTLQEYAAR